MTQETTERPAFLTAVKAYNFALENRRAHLEGAVDAGTRAQLTEDIGYLHGFQSLEIDMLGGQNPTLASLKLLAEMGDVQTPRSPAAMLFQILSWAISNRESAIDTDPDCRTTRLQLEQLKDIQAHLFPAQRTLTDTTREGELS